jgi:predicted  nucleic acid-binding Zn-ribbon protein
MQVLQQDEVITELRQRLVERNTLMSEATDAKRSAMVAMASAEQAADKRTQELVYVQQELDTLQQVQVQLRQERAELEVAVGGLTERLHQQEEATREAVARVQGAERRCQNAEDHAAVSVATQA